MARPRPGSALALVALWSSAAAADPEAERHWVVGVGGAGEVELGNGAAHGGGNVMVEWEAIADWLEIEVDASLLAAGSGVEVPVDLLFKKPFRLSSRAELMIGAGPEVVLGDAATRYGVELAVDFMYWPTRRFGAWAEPAYDVTFASGTSQSLAITAGVMIGW
jgi:hypothetical protein